MKELENETPGLVMEVITLVLRDGDTGIEELTRNLRERDINYPKVADLAHKLKGIGSSVGGCRVSAACVELRQASNAKNKQRCLADFDAVKCEYLVLRESLNHILQMERTINADEPKRRHE
ncbi:PREDICTED: histidine-containing phosphotransfer protein 2-like [Prunus mume]|uniref:Histidine-containing phosphotransfer protein n=1 Tax=Prunus mume TaxID=102107 RepID=A0ABM0NNM0_PRUMU|nr:PREDICTED: histidine-containing phosphotransfer protein 2-like [Prunus mume]